MSGKEPDKMLSASSFYSVNSHAAHGLVLREANHIQAHTKEQVQPCSARRAVAPSLSSSQLERPEQAASTRSSASSEQCRGLHSSSRCGPGPQHHPSSRPAPNANSRCWIFFPWKVRNASPAFKFNLSPKTPRTDCISPGLAGFPGMASPLCRASG